MADTPENLKDLLDQGIIQQDEHDKRLEKLKEKPTEEESPAPKPTANEVSSEEKPQSKVCIKLE